MKCGLIAISGLMAIIGSGSMAAEIDSGVIHNYSFLGLGYGYAHDIADSGVDGHGAIGQVSIEENNFVLTAGGGYFWATDDEPDVEFWSGNATFGYVLRFAQNRINLIPNVGGAYTEVDVEDSSESADAWSIFPGVGVSFAINNRLAINGSYAWNYNFESEDEDHLFSGGAKFALFNQVGLSANAQFSKEFGFTGATAAIEFHY